MKFSEAFIQMMKGKKVTRPGWQGYWYISNMTGLVTIHLANGEEIDSGFNSATIMNTLAEDWAVVK